MPGVVSTVASRLPFAVDCAAICWTSLHVARVRVLARRARARVDERRRRRARRRPTTATRPSRRSSGAGPAAGRATSLPPSSPVGPPRRRAGEPRRLRRLARRRLVVEEVELDVVVALVPLRWSNLPTSVRRAKEFSWREVEAEGVVGRPRAGTHPRTVPAAAAARLGWDGPCLARARRAKRARRRAEDGRPRGQGGRRAPSARRKAAAALRHPRCQRIYALARDTGHVYIAYEYVPGRTLREALNTGEIGDREAVEVAAQLLDALAHAHGRGIVHRDVKPSNVLLAEAATAIDVRLLDFGLAQMAEFDTLTARGDVPGTLAYVSPERLLGEEATEAADVWAVGVMLWEALARTPSVPGLDDAPRRTARSRPARRAARARCGPTCRAAIHDAVARALALDPARAARRPTGSPTSCAAPPRSGASRRERPADPARAGPRAAPSARCASGRCPAGSRP